MVDESGVQFTFYDCLHSFHMRKEKMCKAALAIYDKSMCYSQLPVPSDSLNCHYDNLLT